jgi:hypothetical protein
MNRHKYFKKPIYYVDRPETILPANTLQESPWETFRIYFNWFRHSKVDGGGDHRHTDSMVISYAYFHFFKIRKTG